jgi:uncharacterized protein YutE (UPF0331/DUF86 family)
VTPDKLSKRVVADRIGWVEEMLERIRALPLRDEQTFLADPRNVGAAESYLRRALEALLDLGRHVLAKGFGKGITEYKQVALRLQQTDVLTKEEGDLLEQMAGYRNRMVHFYHEVTSEELYLICTTELGDIERVVEGFKRWIREHPERMDETL